MRVPFLSHPEEGPKRGTVILKMSSDLWLGLEKSSNPEVALRQRTIDELRFRGRYSDAELEVVDQDPVFAASVRDEYVRAADQMKYRRHLPRTLKIHYQLPGTRVRGGVPN